MIHVPKIPTSGFSCSTTEQLGISEFDSDPGLSVIVVFTTTEGTLVALRTAGCLVRNLGARILLVVPHVVPLHFPVDQPPVAIPFLEQRQLALVSASGIEAEEISITIYLCRNRKECLREVMRSRSLVVIGGKRRWWFTKAQKLERHLRSLGHHVVFVEMEAKHHAGSLLHSNLRAVFCWVLGLYQGL